MNLGKFNKFIPFLIGVAVFALLMAGMGYMVYLSIARYADEKSAFKQAEAERKTLRERDPFPSEENIKIEQENQRILADKFSGLLDSLNTERSDSKIFEPTAFMSNLEAARSRMDQQLTAAGVAMPPRFQYGFEKYVGGAMPQEADVSKLAYQLRVIETLCAMLVNAKAAELLEISREVFEIDVLPAGRGGRQAPHEQPSARRVQNNEAGVDEGGELFTKLNFRFRFRAVESSLMAVLNNMASNQLFMCVSNFKIRNIKDTKDSIGRDFRPIDEAIKEPGKPPADLETRDKRLTLGREALIVEMDVMVYRFAARGKKAEQPAAFQSDSSPEDRGVRETHAQPAEPPAAAPEPSVAPPAPEKTLQARRPVLEFEQATTPKPEPEQKIATEATSEQARQPETNTATSVEQSQKPGPTPDAKPVVEQKTEPNAQPERQPAPVSAEKQNDSKP